MNPYDEIRQLKQALVDADEVARLRGDNHGLCDSIDNSGGAYPSQWIAEIISEAKTQGFYSLRRAEDAIVADKQQKDWVKFEKENG